MGQRTQLNWGVSRVEASTLDLLEDEERRCLDLSITQISIMRQMVFPWAFRSDRLVESHTDYQTTVDMPVAYLEALEDLEVLLSGAYNGPKTGCPVGERFVNRGDPAGADFAIGSGLTADNAWHTLALSSIINDSLATRALLQVSINDGAVNNVVTIRQLGQSNEQNAVNLFIQTAGSWNTCEGTIMIGAPQCGEYKIGTGMDSCYIVVKGWWVPA